MVLRMCRWIAVVLVVLAAAVLFNVASPAWACGCGAYVPDNPGSSVADERALIAWDGTTEDILMSLSVTGSSDRAAWVMPVPSAGSRQPRRHRGVRRISARLTAPRIEYRDSWWPTIPWLVWAGAASDTAGAPAGAVNVLGRQRLGPFDVTRLAADDPTALANWLRDNGFPHPDGLDDNLAPYVADGWEIVAIQLVPAETGGSLSGALQPLRLSFASDTVVYPMRLSRSATMSQSSTCMCWRRIEWIPRRFPSRAISRLWSSPGPSSAATPPHWPTSSVTRVSDPMEEHDLRPGGDRGRLHIRAGARRYPLPASRLSHARPWTHHVSHPGGVDRRLRRGGRRAADPADDAKPAPPLALAQISDGVAELLRRGPHRGDIGSGAQHVTRDRGK